jgi:hypothetical protein
MQADELEMLERLHRKRSQSMPPAPARPSPTIHFTELPEDPSETLAAKNWNLYRREVGRLLAEGHEGHWVLIENQKIVGIWQTEEEANGFRVQRFLMRDVLVHQILTHEPILRGPTRSWRS